MKNNPVVWFEIYVQDMDRARKFYETVLQLKLEKMDSPEVEMWSFPAEMDRWGAGGSLVKMDGVPSGGNSVLIYFSCEDCKAGESRAENAGGRIKQKKMSIGEYGYISLVFDTEGNIFGLHQCNK
ncbi:MAG: VOC family protein [Gammaproteobacteria bacterium]|nr:VOC family protein [Gammaproteobacteria bacterium]MBU1731490.1 VOC family protein [Gammaproteobacteria bacterium]MBU1892995.1 VOC family protein [Gammaproteobacteria bacterium]